jgi:processing peptidase subunit alpha
VFDVDFLQHEFYGVAILHMLLGGGTSFSTGGPGKGMFTRLYTNVLNRYPWIHMAQSFTSCYTDVGLLGVMGTAEPEQAGKLVDVLCTELLYLTMNIEDTELLRAKNQLKTSMFFNLESRSVLVDDIGRQLLLQGRRLSGDQHSEVIDGYPKAELCKLMKRILSSPPTIVAYGRPSSLKKIPKKDLVESFFKRMSS